MRWNKIVVFLIVVSAIIISFYFDISILKLISSVKTEFMQKFFLGVDFLGSNVLVILFLTAMFLWKKQKRKKIFALWFAFLLSMLTSFIIKILIRRPRPFQQGLIPLTNILEKSVQSFWDFSLPSFHAMLVFCALPLLSKEFPKLKYLWIGFASLVALSRIYFGFHFLSDVIAGGVIGYLIGIALVKAETKNKFFENVYEKIFRD